MFRKEEETEPETFPSEGIGNQSRYPRSHSRPGNWPQVVTYWVKNLRQHNPDEEEEEKEDVQEE